MLVGWFINSQDFLMKLCLFKDAQLQKVSNVTWQLMMKITRKRCIYANIVLRNFHIQASLLSTWRIIQVKGLFCAPFVGKDSVRVELLHITFGHTLVLNHIPAMFVIVILCLEVCIYFRGTCLTFSLHQWGDNKVMALVMITNLFSKNVLLIVILCQKWFLQRNLTQNQILAYGSN